MGNDTSQWINPEAGYFGEPQFSTVFDNATIGMALLASDTRRLRVNKAFCEMLGYAESEMLAQSMLDMTHPDDQAEDRRQLALLVSGEKSTYQREKRFIDSRGHTVWAAFTCSALPHAPGRPLQLITQIQDITERKAAEQARQDSERRFRAMVKLSPDWYWEQDEQFRFTDFSGNEFQSAWRPDQLAAIGKCRWDIPGVTPVNGSWDDHKAMLQAHLPFRYFEYTRADEGQPLRYYSSSGDPVFDAKGRFCGYRGTARDITESTHASRQARETATRLTNTLENLDEAFISVDRDWRLTYVNSRAESSVGKPRASLLGKVLWEAVPVTTNSPFTALYRRAMADNVTLQAEEYLPVYGAWIRVKVYPSAQGLSIFYRNVTQRVKAREEILRLNAELEERVKQRTAELEAANKELQFFAYSIAHDLRGPLGAMDGFSQMLERALGPEVPEKAQHYMRRIRAGVNHMGELTEGLLALAKLSRTELHNVDVDLVTLAKAELALLQSRSPDRPVELVMPGALPARGDPRLLGQVLGNLLGNAWKFTSRQAAPRIELGSLPAPAGEAGLTYFVRDNGAGFDMEYAARLFEPFQRLHSADEFEGTGIGLAVVQKIVMRHGGRIWAESVVGGGATFYFTLAAQ
ncbi:MAG: PAS domain S-box protein [Pseudomonadota bacterium]